MPDVKRMSESPSLIFATLWICNKQYSIYNHTTTKTKSEIKIIHPFSLLSNAVIWGWASVTTSFTGISWSSTSMVLMKHSFSIMIEFLSVSRLSTVTICTMSLESCSRVVYVQYCAQWPVEWRVQMSMCELSASWNSNPHRNKHTWGIYSAIS